ncbi:MAG: hypothetical protein DYG92_10320 [Leptolyngbya sp. PLA1]|nr:hypothetical protein [Leptolyngbya sp. PLA1]
MSSLPPLVPTDADGVEAALLAGARACFSAACRRGSIETIDDRGVLIATGDLHDNPLHLAKLLHAAHLTEDGSPHPNGRPRHLILHEIIHGDHLLNGMDLSYRVLARVARLKTLYPEHVHVLLGNHELAQMLKSGIVKDGVKSVDAFNAGLEYVFGGEFDRIDRAIATFVRAMPLALRARTPRGDILCAHSLPPAASMGRFDTTILSRELTDDDYVPRQGSAHLMVWGRGYDAEGLEDLVERWGAYLFILGHEKAPEGVKFVPPNAVILNSDHERGVCLPIDLAAPPAAGEAADLVRPLMTMPCPP